jgi:hypothetical protein
MTPSSVTFSLANRMVEFVVDKIGKKRWVEVGPQLVTINGAPVYSCGLLMPAMARGRSISTMATFVRFTSSAIPTGGPSLF